MKERMLKPILEFRLVWLLLVTSRWCCLAALVAAALRRAHTTGVYSDPTQGCCNPRLRRVGMRGNEARHEHWNTLSATTAESIVDREETVVAIDLH